MMDYHPYPGFPPREPIRPTHFEWGRMSDEQRDRYLATLAGYLSQGLRDIWPELCAMQNCYQLHREAGNLDPQWKL